MGEQIRTGAIMIQGKSDLPDSMILDSERVLRGWMLAIDLDRRGLEQKIRDAGWTFFSLRSDFRAGGFGLGVEKATRKALDQVLSRLKFEPFNCVEVTAIDKYRVWGLHYVSVSARARHIRPSAITTVPKLSAN